MREYCKNYFLCIEYTHTKKFMKKESSSVNCKSDSNDSENNPDLLTISLEKKNINSRALKLYYQKADALQDIDSAEGLYLFSEDKYPRHGAKRFILAKRKQMWKRIKDQQKSYYYENIESEQVAKLHIDIDSYSGRDMKLAEKIYLLKSKCQSVIKKVNAKLLEHRIINPQIIVLRSKLWNSKLSAHIIYKNVCTKTIIHQKQFFLELENELGEDFDPRIYRVGCFRMYGCQKKERIID